MAKVKVAVKVICTGWIETELDRDEIKKLQNGDLHPNDIISFEMPDVKWNNNRDVFSKVQTLNGKQIW